MMTTRSETYTPGHALLSIFQHLFRHAGCRFSHLIILATLTSFVLLPVNAQVATGDILGTIVDTAGAAVLGAAVHLENSGTHESRNVKSNSSGEYIFSSLQPGTYVVTVTSPTFKTYNETNIVVLATDRVRIDAKLQAGAVNETVDVSAVSTSLQTDNPTVGSTITEKTLVDAPLNGRNYFNIVQVQAGVSQGSATSLGSGNNQTDRRLSSSVSANGQQEIFNNNLVDGLDNNGRTFGAVLVRPSVEAIGEVRTDINLYNAELGRTSGAVINVITRSGTNQFHGSLYEFIRNDITDSRTYFATTSILPRKPELRQNQFGGSFGGPIFKDKTFFFADFESFRRIDGNNSVFISTVPTAAEEATPGYLADRGLSNIPTATIDPTALAYFKLFPAPNLGAIGSLANNYLSNPTASLVTNTGDLRIDHNFNQNNHLFGRYSYNNTSANTPTPFPRVNGIYAGGNLQGPGTDTIPVDSGQLSYTHIFTPSLLLDLKMGYTFFGGTILPPNYGTNYNDQAPYLIPNANECAVCSGLALIAVTGLSPIGDAATEPSFVAEHNTQFAGSVTYTHGHHTYKAGASLIRRNFTLYNNLFPKGYNIFTSIPGFLHGAPYITNRQILINRPHDTMLEPSGYFQDSWRVNEKLSLSLGVRYDVFTKPNEKDGNYANFDLGSLTLIKNNTGGITNQYHDVSPRVGFNATIAPGTILRGGFGLSFYDGDSNTGLQLTNPPIGFASGTVINAASPISVTGVPAIVVQSTATANLAGALSSKPLHEPDNYVEQYNLLLQKDFNGTVFTLGYVGQVGRHLSNDTPNVDLPAPAGPSVAGTPAPALVYAAQLPKVNTIAVYRNNAVSSYNSLQVSVERRITHGLTANANYTLAHNLDNLFAVFDGDTTSTNGFGDLPAQLNTYEYGNSALDLRHRFAGFFSYDLPFGKNGSHLNQALFGGFRFNGLGFLQTGAPFTVTSSAPQGFGPSATLATINLPTISTDRPNVGAPYQSTGAVGVGTLFFNPNAFTQQPLGTAGNERRNQFFGPHDRRGDLSLFKTIPLREHTQLELRAECINITNTASFDRPNHTIIAYNTGLPAGSSAAAAAAQAAPGGDPAVGLSGGFGSVTNVLPGSAGRQFQFAGRLSF